MIIVCPTERVRRTHAVHIETTGGAEIISTTLPHSIPQGWCLPFLLCQETNHPYSSNPPRPPIAL